MAESGRELRELLISSYSKDELYTLATDIAGNAELVFSHGGTLEAWARELVAWCGRRNKTEILLNCIKETRPEAFQEYSRSLAIKATQETGAPHQIPGGSFTTEKAGRNSTKIGPGITDSGKLSVFLCHSSQDKPIVRWFCQQLNQEPWIGPWLDEEKLLPGMDWKTSIETAVEAADAVLVFLSQNSVTKEGYVQRELSYVLEIALEKPEGTVFVIPVRLDDCDLPRRLRSLQYVDAFPVERLEGTVQRIIASLKTRRKSL